MTTHDRVGATDQPPFLTSWAAWGADVLAVAGHASLGQELLHLVGNAVFLAGLVALPRSPARRAGGSDWRWWCRAPTCSSTSRCR